MLDEQTKCIRNPERPKYGCKTNIQQTFHIKNKKNIRQNVIKCY